MLRPSMARTLTAVLRVFLLGTLCLETLPAMISAYYSGEATYYGPYYTPSACYGYNTRPFPHGILIAAASSSLFRGGAGCGRTYSVTCTGAPNNDGEFYPCSDNPTVAVMVVDFCADCVEPGLALSQEAFSRIANPADADQIFIDFFPDDNF